MSKYREKQPVIEVDAVVWDGKNPHPAVSDEGVIYGHSEQLAVAPGDFVVTYSDGQVRPMKPDLFAATYEPVSAPKALKKGE